MNKKIYLILLIILVSVVFIVVLFSRQKFQTPVASPTPTDIIPTKFTVQPSLTPTLIPPAPFTGVLKETIPQPTIDIVQQEQNLRKKTPVEEMYFTIAFDYSKAKFLVNLKEPKVVSTNEFKKWKTSNFNLIPDDIFIIQ